MSRPELEFRHLHQSRFSSAIRGALAMTVIAVTLLPAPITYFGVLPTYRMHAWFLLFYAPFLCLLTLCYLFYVRDSLARAMFANLLIPAQPPDPYYLEPVGRRLKRGFRRLKAVLLGILPALLVIASMYCVSRYLGSLNQSVALATEAYVQRSAGAQEVGMRQEDRERVGRRRSADRIEGKRVPPAGAIPADSLPAPSDSLAVHSYVLRATVIDDIPQLLELTLLYTGAFVTLLIAVTLMALKEYAREALGLSEHEVMFGRYQQNEGD
jgi:hypothetical protein